MINGKYILERTYQLLCYKKNKGNDEIKKRACCLGVFSQEDLYREFKSKIKRMFLIHIKNKRWKLSINQLSVPGPNGTLFIIIISLRRSSVWQYICLAPG